MWVHGSACRHRCDGSTSRPWRAESDYEQTAGFGVDGTCGSLRVRGRRGEDTNSHPASDADPSLASRNARRVAGEVTARRSPAAVLHLAERRHGRTQPAPLTSTWTKSAVSGGVNRAVVIHLDEIGRLRAGDTAAVIHLEDNDTTGRRSRLAAGGSRQPAAGRRQPAAVPSNYAAKPPPPTRHFPRDTPMKLPLN